MRWSSKKKHDSTKVLPPYEMHLSMNSCIHQVIPRVFSWKKIYNNNSDNNWCCGISGHLQSQHSGHNQHWLLPRDGHRQHQQECYQVHGVLQRYRTNRWQCMLTAFLKCIFPCTLCARNTGILDCKQLRSQRYRSGNDRSGDNSGSVLASQSKGCRFKSQQEQRENFLLQGQLTVLTLYFGIHSTPTLLQ